MANSNAQERVFKRALLISFLIHFGLFLFIAVSPSLPKSSKKGMIQYVNLISLPGGGSGGGRGGGGVRPKPAEEIGTTAIKKESLRDLTPLAKFKEESKPSMTHPVEKPKREPKTKADKKPVISKPSQSSSSTSPAKTQGSGETSGEGPGSGSGLRIGVGSGPGSGEGFGPGFGSQIGLANFPFAYYIQSIQDRISSNWFKSLVDPGVSGNLQVTIFFKIHRDGRYSDLKVVESSNVRPFDLSALRAIQTAANFPPLPAEYEEEHLGIYITFEHSK
jgi:protein TonB